jgi:hypothetical protein
VNWYENVIDAAQTLLLFPVQRLFSVRARGRYLGHEDHRCLLRLPGGIEAQPSFIYAARTSPRPRGRAPAGRLGLKNLVLMSVRS